MNWPDVKRELTYAAFVAFNVDMLDKESRSVYECWKRLEEPPFTSSVFWQRHWRRMRQELRVKGLENFKRELFNALFASKSKSRAMFLSAMWQYYNHVKSIDKWRVLDELEEPALGNPETFLFDGSKALSMDLLQSVEEFYRVVDALGCERYDVVNVCEVGGGYGRTAWVFLNVMPNAHVTLVDMPESLITAYWYLTNLLTTDRVSFLLPQHLPLIPKGAFDAYVNVYSFQEMTMPTIEWYVNEFGRIGGKVIYLKNRVIERNIVDNIDVAIDAYPVPPGMEVTLRQQSTLYADMIEKVIT